ncbi:poly-beta-hydroxybutyrate polymerase [mine drainage metagenome]|uniref:Poly-beta-hydroxybutyrate polymerase n=1 Tax=mine drainage metagenome TaxID=410659 RepID=A0A1J5T745_9ZZZZ
MSPHRTLHHPPSPRQGPRPLPFHLISQATTLFSSQGALPGLRNGSLTWKPGLRAAAETLRQTLAGLDAEAFSRAVQAESARRMAGFLDGIEAYRRHPYRRALPEAAVVWRDGGSRLLDYAPAAAPEAPPVLVVPSLINRAYILDLTPKRSLMRYMAEKGLRPFLLDWGTPGPLEKTFDLNAYIGGRLSRALDAVLALAGKPALVGYCMGGLLGLGLGLLRQEDVGGLALLATPWDFHQPDTRQARMLQSLARPLEDVMELEGVLPLDLLQVLFASIDPSGADRKFRAFARLPPRGAKARDFVALEDWLNDGVPLAAPVARDCLFGWYGRNDTAAGRWCLGGRAMRPQDFTKPSLAMIPLRDRIVPPVSALPLARSLPRCRIRQVAVGHIGMMTGRRAKTEIYGPLVRWLKGVR